MPATFRFRRHQRISRQRDFDRLFQCRCTVSEGPLVLYVDCSPADHPRLGLSVSRRVGCAVVRNREKRRVRTAFRLRQHELPVMDMICVIRRTGRADEDYGEILVRLAQQAKVRLARRKAAPPRS